MTKPTLPRPGDIVIATNDVQKEWAGIPLEVVATGPGVRDDYVFVKHPTSGAVTLFGHHLDWLSPGWRTRKILSVTPPKIVIEEDPW